MMLCQCRFIDCNEWTAVVRDADRTVGSVYVGVEADGKFSVLSTQFSCEPEILQKIACFIKKNLNIKKKRQRAIPVHQTKNMK